MGVFSWMFLIGIHAPRAAWPPRHGGRPSPPPPTLLYRPPPTTSSTRTRDPSPNRTSPALSRTPTRSRRPFAPRATHQHRRKRRPAATGRLLNPSLVLTRPTNAGCEQHAPTASNHGPPHRTLCAPFGTSTWSVPASPFAESRRLESPQLDDL